METATSITIKDPTCVSIRVDETAEEILKDGEVIQVNHAGMEFAPGQVIPVRDGLFRIESIQKKGYHLYNLFSMQTSDSAIFLTPMIFDTRAKLKWNTYFMNLFIWMEGMNDTNLYLLIRKGYSDSFQVLDKFIQDHSDFVDRLEVDDFSYIYIFTVPVNYEEDFLKFIKGKYSELSEELKVRILDFHAMKKTHEIYGILHKTKKRRIKVEKRIGQELPESAELYHIIDEDRETYKDRYRVFRSDAME
tara:strand:- start:19674 stop:20417 length:744 start_codon:yes stop_codon:yes gene_type:complete